ncbi:MarR family winged helix-turn-helix transcriptional regulator [Pseudaestuariivita atlantica]|nr:MarR family transcriptional regulator [Pseudaestuariivita atlantica]
MKDDLIRSLIHDVAHQLRLRIDEALRPYDLTRVTWLAISIVDQNEMLTQSELAARLELGTAATGKLIDRLEERGLVRRHDHPDDRRANLLSITDQARDLLERIEPIGEFLREDVLQDLGQHERQRLRQSLQTIKCRLTEDRSQVA